jgi:hypothetical protein
MTHAVHPQQFHPHAHSNGARFPSALNFIAGIYLLISAWIGGVSAGNRANGIIFGIIVAVLAALRFSESAGRWASWVNALIGIWLIISPWVYGYADESWMWNSIIVGIIMLVLGAWSAMASRMSEEGASPGGTR